MIVFYTELNVDKLRTAFNNDVVRFGTDTGNDPVYCDITMTGTEVRLYPAPDGTFYFNFMPYVSALINTRNFEDTLQTDIITTDPDSFVYPYNDGTLYASSVTFSIAFDEGLPDTATRYLTWISGAEQLTDFYNRNGKETWVLSPFMKDTKLRYYLKYWTGYPFDIPIYLITGKVTVMNLSNGLEQAFTMPTSITRLVISDGRSDATLEDVLPLLDGTNELRLVDDSLPEDDNKYIDLEKIPYKCGVYLKWLNNLGGYSYWLFEETYSIDRSGKAIGELAKDNANLDDTFNRAIQIGRESQETIRVVAELLNDEEVRVLSTILDSPKVYLFKGQPFSRSDYRDWVEVTLKTGNIRTKNARQPLNNFVLDFELPQRYTQTL